MTSRPTKELLLVPHPLISFIGVKIQRIMLNCACYLGTEGSTELPLRPNQHSSPAPSRAQTQPSRSQVLTREDIANRINNLLIKQLSGWHGWYVAMLARSYATRVFGRVRRGHFGACGLPFLSKISMVVGQEGHMKYMALAITSCSPVEILLKGHLRDTEGQDPLVDDASMDALRDGFSDAAVLELNRINAT